MKKKKKKRSRLAIPKEKRFRRFWLRRFLLCLAVVSVITPIRMQKQYKEDRDSYESNRSDFWKERADNLSKEKKESSSKGRKAGAGITYADYYLQLDGAQRFTNMLVNSTAFGDSLSFGNTWGTSPNIDRSVILVRPETVEYYVSENQVNFRTYDKTKDERHRSSLYYADTPLADQIISTYQEDRKDLNLLYWTLSKSYVVGRFLNYGFWYERFRYDHMWPFRIYVDGDQVCKADFGWMDYYGCNEQFKDLHTFGSEPADNCREIRISTGYESSDIIYQTFFDTEPDSAYDNRDQEHLYYSIWVYGSPTDSDSYQTAHAVADYMENGLVEKYREKIAYLQGVIDDTSGEKKTIYYKDELRDETGIRPKSEEIEELIEEYDIPSPEEALESLYENIGTHMAISLVQRIDSPFYYDGDRADYYSFYPPFHTIGSVPVKIGQETWYIVYFEHLDYLHSKVPEYIATVFDGFIGVVFLSLIWAVISYLVFRSRFKMDEYRRSLTATLAHDLKSPLMAISSYAENIANDVCPEKKTHYSESILENTQYMDNIIVNVLELSRLERLGKVSRKKVDLIALTNDLIGQMEDRMDEKELYAEATGSCKVRADEQQMILAIRNLLDNAIKYSPERTQILIKGQKKTFTVTNEMEAEEIEDPQQLCEAFVMGDEARSNRSGTGLGLSLVQQIVRLNRMKMTVEGKAHTFRVTLRRSLFYPFL